MNRSQTQTTILALLCAGTLMLASCTQEDKPTSPNAPTISSSVTTRPGVAGGVAEDVFILQAVVTAIDVPSRKVSLSGGSGNQYTFKADPIIKNLPQVSVGDKVTATFARRMVVVVSDDKAEPSLTREAGAARAIPGERPKMLVAEETEAIARVVAIDPVARTANLEFVDNIVKTVPVRADVDLSKYKVGDTVKIRITTALTVLVETP